MQKHFVSRGIFHALLILKFNVPPCLFQFDFQEKVLCIIQRGNRNKKFAFMDIRGFDSEVCPEYFLLINNVSFFIH